MSILLSVKRIIKRGSLLVMIGITVTCILLCGMLMGDDGLPDCGFVCGDDALAVAVCNQLERDGLIRYESDKELIRAIQDGVIGSGFSFPDDFSERIESVDIEDAVTCYEHERATITTIYKYRTTAYILEHYVPHLVSMLLKQHDVNVSPSEAAEYIGTYLENDVSFEFTMENAKGEVIESEHYSMNLSMGAVSLLLFFALGLFSVPYGEKQFFPIAKRVGLKKAFTTYALPSIVCSAVLFFAVAALSLILSDALFESRADTLILPCAVYTLFLSALGITATAIFGNTEKIRIPIMALSLASLALCPIFIDFAELLNLPIWLRHIVPTYFFYTACENILACALVAAIFFITACALYALVCKKKLRQ